MSCKTAVALLLSGLVFLAVPCLVQAEEPVKTFKLLRESDSAAEELDLENENEINWERGLDGRDIDLSFALGFMDLNTTLLQHNQIIYKYTTEFTYWGDVELSGESAFAPVLRLGYSVNKWLAIEANASMSFSEYYATITNMRARKNEPEAPIIDEVVLGEYDAEHRSLFTFTGGANALVYPMNLISDGRGWLQPFVTGGYGRMWYDMNSQYSDGPTATNNFNIGGGLRIIGDEEISIRFEVLYHMNTLEFDPPTYFEVLDEGTTEILLEEHPFIDGQRVDRPVDSYASQKIKSLNWSLGIQASF